MLSFNAAQKDVFFQVLASVEIEQLAPKPHCCIGNNYAGQGLIGTHYDVNSAPVEVIDSKTLRIKQFSFSGTQAPGNVSKTFN